LTGQFDVAISVATWRVGLMAKFATVRDLKNQTTALIREAEKGKAVVVTRRGKPVATLKPFEKRDLDEEERYPTQAFDALRRKILARHPRLAKESPAQTRRRFDKITEKIKRSLPFKTWQEMDRFAKGDRHGLAR
jgi:prevent-host-death family protein